ncbi:hypothetical protein HYQ46_002951 [Verticillium longisporum]|nr:hypothetical protein HYQ44_003132 [Verticillium longisporum]KAG7148177.1 hypothetical protein HYQ46_002951 [Verticillium longisporum]
MSRGPLPSQICLLADLSVKSPGDKVRFLGCVTAYTVATATLVLCHSFPSGTDTAAHVDVKLVLDSLTGEQVRIGEWVNIIGYITHFFYGLPAQCRFNDMKSCFQATKDMLSDRIINTKYVTSISWTSNSPSHHYIITCCPYNSNKEII